MLDFSPDATRRFHGRTYPLYLRSLLIVCSIAFCILPAEQSQWAQAQSKRTRSISLQTLPIAPPIDGIQRITLRGELDGEGEIVLNKNTFEKPDRFGDFQSNEALFAPPQAVRFQRVDASDDTGKRRKLYEILGDLAPPGARYYLVSPSRKTGVYRLVIDRSAVDRRVLALEQIPALKTPAKRVQAILRVNAVVLDTHPPTLLVTATGQVPSAGWTHPRLTRRVYVDPPQDGIWEYDLFGEPPKNAAATVVSQIQARNRWPGYDADSLKGVRVYGVGDGVKTITLHGPQ